MALPKDFEPNVNIDAVDILPSVFTDDFNFTPSDSWLDTPTTEEFTATIDPQYLAQIDHYKPIIEQYAPSSLANVNSPYPGQSVDQYDPLKQQLPPDFNTADGALQGLDLAMQVKLPQGFLGAPKPQIADPIYSSRKSSQFERYYQHPKFAELGFHPYANNEEYYNQNSTIFNDMSRMMGHFYKQIGSGFLSNYRSIGDLFDSNDNYFTTPDLQTASEFEDAMAIGMSTREGVGSFFNNLLLNSGYTFGIIGSIALEEAILAGITAATRGAAGPLTIPRMMQQGKRLGQTVSNSFKIPRMMKATRQMLQTLNKSDNARNFWRATKTGEWGVIGTLFAPETMAAVKSFKSGKNAAQNLTNLAKTQAFFGGFYRDLRSINLALAESKLEGGMVYNQQLINGMAIEKNKLMPGEEITPDTMSVIKENAQKASFATTMMNFPLIYFSNQFVLGNALGGFNKSFARLMNENISGIGKRLIQTTASRKATGELSKNVIEYAGDGIKGFAKTLKSAGVKGSLRMGLGSSLRYFSNNLAEGLQEIGQEAIAAGTSNYFANLQYNPTRSHVDLMRTAVSSAADSQFSSQGIETFLSGFLMGGIVQGPQKLFFQGIPNLYTRIATPEKYKEYQENKKKFIDSLVKVHNEAWNKMAEDEDSIFDLNVANIAVQKEVADQMKKSAYEDDIFGFIDAKDFGKFQAMYTIFSNGTADIFRSQLKDYLNLTDEELAQAFPTSQAEIKSGKMRERLNGLLNNIDVFEDRFTKNKDKFQNPYDRSKFEKGTTEYKEEFLKEEAYNHAKYLALFTEDGFNRSLERANSIYSELSAEEELMSKIQAKDITVLLDINSIENEIKLLNSEILALEDAPENKELKKQKLKKAAYLFQIQAILTDEANLTKKGNFDLRKISKLEGLFKEYIQFLADSRNDFVNKDKIKETLKKIVDHKTLTGRAKAYDKAIEYLANPERLNEIVERTYDIYKTIFKNNKKLFEERIKQHIEKVEINELLNQLANLDIYPDPMQVEIFLRTGNADVLTKFYNEKGEVNSTTDKKLYDDILSKINIYKESTKKETEKSTKEEIVTKEDELNEVVDQLKLAPDIVLETTDKDIHPTIKALLRKKYNIYKATAENPKSGKEWLNSKESKDIQKLYEVLKTIWYNEKEVSEEDYNKDKGFLDWLKTKQEDDNVLNAFSAVPGISFKDFLNVDENITVSSLSINDKGTQEGNVYKLTSYIVDNGTFYLIERKDGKPLSDEIKTKYNIPQGTTSNKNQAYRIFNELEKSVVTNITNEDLNFNTVNDNTSKLSQFEPVRALAHINGLFTNNKEDRYDAFRRYDIIMENLTPEEIESLELVVSRNNKINDLGFYKTGNKEPNPFIKRASSIYNIGIRIGDENVRNRINNILKAQGFDISDSADGIFAYIPNNSVVLYDKNGKVITDPRTIDKESAENIFFYNNDNALQNIKNNFAIQLNLINFISNKLGENNKVIIDYKEFNDKFNFKIFSKTSVQKNIKPKSPNDLAYNTVDGTIVILDNRKITIGGTTQRREEWITNEQDVDKQIELTNKIKSDLQSQLLQNEQSLYDFGRSMGAYVAVVKAPNGVYSLVELKAESASEESLNNYFLSILEQAKKTSEENVIKDKNGKSKPKNLAYNNDFNDLNKEDIYITTKPGYTVTLRVDPMGRIRLNIYDIKAKNNLLIYNSQTGTKGAITLKPEDVIKALADINGNKKTPINVLNSLLKELNGRKEVSNKDIKITTESFRQSFVEDATAEDIFNKTTTDIDIRVRYDYRLILSQNSEDVQASLNVALNDLLPAINQNIQESKNKAKTPEQKLEEIGAETAVSPEADIERKRQEELNSLKNIKKGSFVRFTSDGNTFSSEKFKVITYNNKTKEMTLSGGYIPPGGLINIDDIEYFINLYYDAELAALEQQPTSPEADIERRRQEELKKADKPKEKAIERINELKLKDGSIQLNFNEDPHSKIIYLVKTEEGRKLILKLLNELVRMRKNGGLTDLESITLDRIEARAALEGYEIIDLIGKEYDDRMTIDVINFEDGRVNNGKKIIVKTAEPQILYKGVLIQRAKVHVLENATDEKFKEALDQRENRIEERKKEINAKYDAELAALEQQPTSQKTEQTSITDAQTIQSLETVDVIDEAIKNRKLEITADLREKKNLKELKTTQKNDKILQDLKAKRDSILGNSKLTNKILPGLTTEDVEDIAVFEEWAQENLPSFISIEDIKTLGNNIKTGGLRVGAFVLGLKDIAGGMNISGTIYTGASNPYRYHEAFHSVFRMLLTDSEISKYLNLARKEVREKLRKEGKSFKQELEKLRNSADTYAKMSEERLKQEYYEEYLADEFEKFKINPRYTKTNSQNKSLFTKIIEWIKSVLGIYKKNEITELFRNIDAAKYRTSKVVSNRFTEDTYQGITLEANALIPIEKIGSEENPGYLYLDPDAANSMIRSMAAIYINREDNYTNRKDDNKDDNNKDLNKTKDELLNDVIKDFKNLYSLDNDYDFDNMSDEKIIKLTEYEQAFEDFSEEIKNAVVKYLNLADIWLEDKLDIADEKEDNEGLRGVDDWDKDASLIGGISSLSAKLRRYLLTTTFESTDIFGNTKLSEDEPLVIPVDFNAVYNGMLKAIEGITEPDKILKSLYIFAQNNEHTNAAVTRLFNDLGITEENILEGKFIESVKNPYFFNSVIKGLENFRVSYIFIHKNTDGRVEVYSAANRDDANTQMDKWGQAFGAIYRNKLSIDNKFKNEALDFINRLSLQLAKNKVIKEITDEKLKEQSKDYSDKFKKYLGISLSPQYIAYNLIQKIENPTLNQSLIKEVNEGAFLIESQMLTILKESLKTSTVGQDYIFSSKKEGMRGHLKKLAIANASFDETVGASVFKNANGDLVYAHQKPTFHLKKMKELNNTELLEELKKQPFFMKNWLLGNDAFIQMAEEGKIGITRISGFKKGSIEASEDGIQEYGTESSNTYGDFTPKEFVTSLLNAYTYLFNSTTGKLDGVIRVEDQTDPKGYKEIATAPVLIKVIEASNTGDLSVLPVVKAVKYDGSSIEITDEVIDGMKNNIKTEFERIKRESNPETRTQRDIEDYNKGKNKATQFVRTGTYLKFEDQKAEKKIVSSTPVKTEFNFQGYKGGFKNKGKGKAEGDGKDKAMREVANGFIGEVSKQGVNNSSTFTSINNVNYRNRNILQLIATDQNNKIFNAFQLSENDSEIKYPVSIQRLSGSNSNPFGAKSNDIIMLARNGVLKNKALADSTKESILNAHNSGAEFVVGDMPGVDTQFIDYLQEIGAKFTIYHTGNKSRINVAKKQINISELFESNSELANQVYEAINIDADQLSYSERVKQYEKLGIKKSDGTPITEDDIRQNPTFYQKNTNQSNDEYVETEKTIRDLAERMADRIGLKVRYVVDRTLNYKGKLEGNTAVINLAYATLDTPIHEILGHPIIRAIKNKKSLIDAGTSEQKDGGPKLLAPIKLEETNILYQNLLKELETGRGKEVLDRVKRDYQHKNNQKQYRITDVNILSERVLLHEKWGLYGEVGDAFIKQSSGSWKLVDKDNYNKGIYNIGRAFPESTVKEILNKTVSFLDKYTLEEQQEEAIVELLGLYTADRLNKVKDGKLISLLKRLLKEIKQFMKSLLKQREVEIDKLPDNMTLGDIADLLAYSDSKLILPGNEVVYTTPDNQTFKTYQEASNHISELVRNMEDVDLNDIKINQKKYITNIDEIKENEFLTQDGFRYIKKDGNWYSSFNLNIPLNNDNVIAAYNSKDLIYDVNEDTGKTFVADGTFNIRDFIEKNKQYEQSKEIIEEWKKVNNIQYDPEEVYSRNQGFYSVVAAYSDFDVNLMFQNILAHIEDNKKAGGEFTISAFTKPIDKRLRHLEGKSGTIRFKIFPKSEDIKWASNIDVFSGSVWDAADKVAENKKSETVGVSYTKAPAIRNLYSIQPNLASIIDDLQHAHNELGIELTGTNFRLEYDNDIPFSTKKLLDAINNILDQKFGKLVEPKIGFKKLDNSRIEKVRNQIDTLDVNRVIGGLTKEEQKEYDALVEEYTELTNGIRGKRPTQTNKNLKESINSIRNRIESNANDYFIEEVVDFDPMEMEEVTVGYKITGVYNKVTDSYNKIYDTEAEANKALNEFKNLLSGKEYTSQALINTKVAALKKGLRKFPRSLIRSEIRPYLITDKKLFEEDEMLFQLLKGDDLTPKERLQNKLTKQQAQQMFTKYVEQTGEQDIEGFKEFLQTQDDLNNEIKTIEQNKESYDNSLINYKEQLENAIKENPNVTFEEAIGNSKDFDNFLKKRLEQEYLSFREELSLIANDSDLSTYLNEGLKLKSGSTNNNVAKSAELLNLKDDLEYNLRQIFFNDLLNTTAINQILLGEIPLTLLDAINEIKRAKAQNAAYDSAASVIAAPEEGIMHPTQRIDLFGFTEPQVEATFNKSNTTDNADAQLWMTLKAFRHAWFGFGKLNKAQNQLLNRIEKGEDIPYEELLGNANNTNKSYAEMKAMLNSKKFVYFDGGVFVKMSAFTLTKQFTSIKDENGNWIPKQNKIALHNLREKMEKYEEEMWKKGIGTIAMAAPVSALKMIKENIQNIDDVLSNDVTFKDNQSMILDANYLGLQTVNPSNKLKITDPTQVKNIVTSEHNDDEKVYLPGSDKPVTIGAIRQYYNKATSDRISLKYINKRNLLFNFDIDYAMDLLNESIKDNELKPDLYSYLQYATGGLEASNATSNILEMFSVDENGQQKYNLNNPQTVKKFEQLFLAFFSKGVLSEKVTGISFTLASDYGVRVYRRVFSVDENGMPDKHEIIRENVWERMRNKPDIVANIDNGAKVGDDNNLIGLAEAIEESKGKGVVIIDRLRFNMKEYDQNGEWTRQRYGEAIIPPHHTEVGNLLANTNKPIPDTVAKMFAVRIPSQDNHSTANLKIVDFMPGYYGSTGVFARELIEISGADFDIDKIYAQIKDFYVNENNEFVEYGKSKTLKDQYRDYIEAMNRDFKKSGSFLKQAYNKFKKFGTGERSIYVSEIEQVQDEGMDIKTVEALLGTGLPITYDQYVEYREKYKSEPYVEALNNDILDYKFALMGNEHVLNTPGEEIPISYQPADTKPLEDLLDELVAEYKYFADLMDKGDLDVNNLKGKLKSFASNKAGANSIGAVVLPNLYLNLMQEYGIKVSDKSLNNKIKATQLELIEKQKFFSDFGVTYDYNERYRKQYVISALITAMTDNAKLRLSAKLGLNKDALAVVANMTALGVPIKTSILLINQPIMRDLYFKAINKTSPMDPGIATLVKNRIKVLKKAFKNLEFIEVDNNLLGGGIINNKEIFGVNQLKDAIKNKKFTKLDAELEYSVLKQFKIAHDIKTYNGNIGTILTLSKSLGKDMQDVNRKYQAAKDLGLFLSDEQYEKYTNDRIRNGLPAIDVRPIFENTWQGTYLKIFKELKERILPNVFLSQSDTFLNIFHRALKEINPYVLNQDMISVIGDDLLSYLTIKGYQYNIYSTEAGSKASLNNSILYPQVEGEKITDVIERLTTLSSNNYFLKTFIISEKATDEGNRSGINKITANTFNKLSDQDKVVLQSSFAELYGNLRTRKDAKNILHYIMVKDGFKLGYGSILEAITPFVYSEFLLQIDTVEEALRNKDNTELFKQTFGLTYNELIDDFIKGYFKNIRNKDLSNVISNVKTLNVGSTQSSINFDRSDIVFIENKNNKKTLKINLYPGREINQSTDKVSLRIPETLPLDSELSDKISKKRFRDVEVISNRGDYTEIELPTVFRTKRELPDRTEYKYFILSKYQTVMPEVLPNEIPTGNYAEYTEFIPEGSYDQWAGAFMFSNENQPLPTNLQIKKFIEESTKQTKPKEEISNLPNEAFRIPDYMLNANEIEANGKEIKVDGVVVDSLSIGDEYSVVDSFSIPTDDLVVVDSFSISDKEYDNMTNYPNDPEANDFYDNYSSISYPELNNFWLNNKDKMNKFKANNINSYNDLVKRFKNSPKKETEFIEEIKKCILNG